MEPYKSCQNDSEHYHQEHCIEECFSAKIAERYKNSLSDGFYVSKLMSCYLKYPGNSVATFDRLRAEFNSFCKAKCARSCVSSSYFVSCESSLADTTERRISLNIKLLNYELVSQIPKVFDLIGSLGGTLGVCLVGLQFVGLVEVFQFSFLTSD